MVMRVSTQTILTTRHHLKSSFQSEITRRLQLLIKASSYHNFKHQALAFSAQSFVDHTKCLGKTSRSAIFGADRLLMIFLTPYFNHLSPPSISNITNYLVVMSLMIIIIITDHSHLGSLPRVTRHRLIPARAHLSPARIPAQRSGDPRTQSALSDNTCCSLLAANHGACKTLSSTLQQYF